jgi:hypothetical protein
MNVRGLALLASEGHAPINAGVRNGLLDLVEWLTENPTLPVNVGHPRAHIVHNAESRGEFRRLDEGCDGSWLRTVMFGRARLERDFGGLVTVVIYGRRHWLEAQ